MKQPHSAAQKRRGLVDASTERLARTSLPTFPPDPWAGDTKKIRRGGRPRRVGRGSASEALICRARLGRAPGYTSSLRAPINVRSRSASRAVSNGFLNVSLMLERSKL